MSELIDKYRRLFERNGYEFRYAKTWHDIYNCYQHSFLSGRPGLKPSQNICRQTTVSDDEKNIKFSLERMLYDTMMVDQNFKTVFKEDNVLKILAKIDEHIR